MTVSVVMIAGSGGQGKTTILDHLRDLDAKWFPDDSNKNMFHEIRSVTRKTAQEQGYSNEKEVLTAPSQNYRYVQRMMLNDWFQNQSTIILDTKSKNGSGGAHHVYFCDRSPFDYLGYQIAEDPSFTWSDLKDWRKSIVDWFVCLRNCGYGLNLVSLPYPTAWMTSEDVMVQKDDYRSINFQKNYRWWCCIQAEIDHYIRTFSVKGFLSSVDLNKDSKSIAEDLWSFYMLRERQARS